MFDKDVNHFLWELTQRGSAPSVVRPTSRNDLSLQIFALLPGRDRRQKPISRPGPLFPVWWLPAPLELTASTTRAFFKEFLVIFLIGCYVFLHINICTKQCSNYSPDRWISQYKLSIKIPRYVTGYITCSWQTTASPDFGISAESRALSWRSRSFSSRPELRSLCRAVAVVPLNCSF